MHRPIIFRSRTVNRNHLSVIVRAEGDEKAEKIIRNIKRAIHKLNRREKLDVSFEIFTNAREV